MAKRLTTYNKGGAGNSPALVGDLSSAEYALPFFYYFTLAKNILSSSPTRVNFNLPIGVIQRIWVEFPRGCSGQVGLSIWRGTNQIFPLPEGAWIRSDNAVMSFAFTHDMRTDPLFVELRGYNEDDTYQHTPWVAFEMRGHARDVSPALQGLIDYLKG